MKHIAKKRFGQNFLTDQVIIQSLVDAINSQPNDLMIEIGPGLGALTQPLLKQLNHLHVVEIDKDIIEWMLSFYPKDKITIHNSDVLKFDFTQLTQNQIFSSLGMDARQQGGGDETVHEVQRKADNAANTAAAPKTKILRVVGNLPYNISSPILFHLLENTQQIIDMHFMLQKEVVERMVAQPSTSEYGRLSVMLQYRLRMEYLITVPPNAFEPAPKVESAFVRCVPYDILPHLAKDEALFAKVVTAAFSQRRKTLRNTLKSLLDDAGFAALNIDPQLRAENLGVDAFVLITNYLSDK